jgi:hypothetical protein
MCGWWLHVLSEQLGRTQSESAKAGNIGIQGDREGKVSCLFNSLESKGRLLWLPLFKLRPKPYYEFMSWLNFSTPLIWLIAPKSNGHCPVYMIVDGHEEDLLHIEGLIALCAEWTLFSIHNCANCCLFSCLLLWLLLVYRTLKNLISSMICLNITFM